MEGRPRDERRLVLRAQRGDARAFAELVEPHREIAFRVAYLVTGDAAEAEDALQEALLKAWRALGRFRPDAPLRPWLLRIAANEARNRRRGAGRREGLALRAAAAAPPGEGASPEEAALDAERRRLLLDALARLPEQARLVLELRYLLDLPEEEVAAVLGVRRGTVKSRSARALERLREVHAARV